MSRRDSGKRRYRRALVPGLLLSVVVHALVIGLGHLGVGLPDDPEDGDQDRAERFRETSLQAVALRRTDARRSASSEANGVTSAVRAPARRPAAAAAPAVSAPRVARLRAEQVPVPAAVSLPTEGRRDERLTATELAALSPGSSQVPRPTSRAARRASGEHRDVGDRFGAIGGSQRAGPRGGGCTVSPGTIIDRRLPRDFTGGG